MHPLAELTVPKGHVAIHWFEQSTYAIKDSSGTVVQIDPYYPRERLPERFVHLTAPLDEATLPTDYILLTHDHGDHTNPETIARIVQSSPDALYWGPSESVARIKGVGVDAAKITTIEAGKSYRVGGMTLHVVYAKPPKDDPIYAKETKPLDVTHLGFVLETEGGRLYFSGDPINHFAEHEALVGAVAALKPEIGFMTNHPSEGEFPFFDGSATMAAKIGVKYAVPAHRSCFVKRDYDPHEWAQHVAKVGVEPLVFPRNSRILYPLGTP
ncbi:MAG: MBL fold metallo-hydrolase [Candidatus Poribacteria bacterium]|nr:MBL fold metallo-hydrolase [Candidatus Poribacteria bacterium]